MDKIINSIVSNYLANYLEINPEKTKTSILSGTVELSGVKFKKNLFTILNLPYLELEDGFIGKIKVKLSLPRFYLYPIIVNVEQIYIKVRPKNVNKISEEEILKTFEIYKQKKLKELEESIFIKLSYLSQEDEKLKDNKKGNYSMIESIINNLHIDIGKIVIIFDDCISNPKYPCSFGVSLNKLIIDSTSKDFTKTKEEDKSSPLKYKKLSLVSLNLFLDKINKEDIIKDEKTGDITANHKIKEINIKNLTDKEKEYLKDSLNFYLYCESEINDYSKDEKYHNYLLRELNFEIKLILNEKYEFNKDPLINALFETSTIFIQLTNKQMNAIKNNLNYISLKDFYQQKTIENFYKSKEKIDDDTIKNYLENYSLYYKTKYIDIYKNDNENKKYLEKMQIIEKNLRIDDIKALREMGNDIINNMVEIGKIDKEIKNTKKSWSNLFSSKKKLDINKLNNEKELKLAEQIKIKERNSTLNQFKNYISGIFNNNDKDKKEDRLQFIFKFIMKELVLIMNEDKKNDLTKVFEMRYDLFKCEILIKVISQYIKLSLRDMEFKQYLSENLEYQKILYSKNKKENDNNIINEEISLLFIEFEHNLLFPISPFKFRVTFDKQMFIIIDYYYLYYLYNLFIRHISDIDLNNLTGMLNEKISSIVKIGYNNLLENKENEENKNNNNDKLFNINVDILLNAPILLFPLYFKDEHNTELMYVSLGQLRINSQLADEKDKNAIYDKYIVEFSNITAKTLNKYKNEEDINDEDGENLIYPSSFNIDIENYIYKKQKIEHKNQKDFSPLIINIKMNNTKFSLSENQIIFMIKYLENYKRTEFEFEKKQKSKKKKKSKKINKKNDNKEMIEIKDEKKENIDEEDNIIDNEEEEIAEVKDNKNKDISNVVKIFMKFGAIEIILEKNLFIDEKIELNKKIKFLLFSFRESDADFLMKSNGSMEMNISFGHFYLYDKDYKLDEKNNEILYINPEFKCIIGTTIFGIKDKNNKNIKFSEIYDFNNNELNNKESIKILFSLDNVNNITTVNIFMSKLTISPNFSTLYRIYIYLIKYIELYNDSMTKIKYERLRGKVKNDKEIQRVNIIDSSAPPPINMKIGDNNDKKKDNNKNKEIIKSKEHSIINVLFSMKGIDVYIPIEPNSHNTSIIFMTIETPMKYVMETDSIVELDSSKIKKINYNIKSNEFIAEINNGSFSIFEYKDDEILLNSINRICDNLDFSFLMKNKLDKNNKSNLFHTIVQMHKELEFSINVNHVIVFLEFFDKINQFLNQLNEEGYNMKIKNEIEDKDDEEIRRIKIEEYIDIREKMEKKRKIKKYENNQKSISNFNNIFTYEFRIANISIKFYDIIDGLYQSLFEFSMTNTNIELLQNNNPKDSKNLMKYLINTLKNERKELNTYDKNNFYIYFNALTNIEIKSLNNYLNQWESFVEPISVKFYYCQLLKRMRPNMEIFIPNMLNINLSLNFAKILSFTLKKFSMNKEELQKNKKGKIFTNGSIPDNEHYLSIEMPILIIENYTGEDMEIWFDNIIYNNENKNYIIKLKSNQKFELTNSLLKKYNVQKVNNNLNSTLSYRFCLDKDFIENTNINQDNLIGHYFNINYHHIDIHDISNSVKISIESCSDNLLCRHIFFNSLISIKNDTKIKDIELANNDNTQKIILKDNKRQHVPISWFLHNKNNNINLLYNNDSQILMKNLSKINDINKLIIFSCGDVILIDIIRYKINLGEYYANKNPIEKKNYYKIDIILSPPIKLINSTPYELYVNNNEKILSTKSLNIYNNNYNLISNYVRVMNEKDTYKKNNEKLVIIKIIKDIKLQIMYENKLLSAKSFINEEFGNNENNNKIEERKSINNFSSYNKTFSIILNDNENKTLLICRLFFNNPYESISYNNKIYETMEVELNSFKYEIVFDCYFVNRTNYDLYLNNRIIEGVNSNNVKNNILIPAKKYIPISKVLLNSKIQLRGKNNYWSEKFELSALGEEFTLNIKNGEDTYNSLGIKIRISDVFNKSFTYIIENKYIVINNLPFDIKIRENTLSTFMTVKSNESKVLLLNKESLDNKENYIVGIGRCYSHMFDINKLGTYDLLIIYNEKIYEENNIDIENKLIELNNNQYLPIRCVIKTFNKNTIYIILSYNKEYINQLRNHTPQTIEIIINKDKQQKYIVKPEKIIPLIYFNDLGRYESFENVKIIFKDRTSELVSLNEISTKFSGKNKDYIIKIQPESNNSVKCIKIYSKNDLRLKDESDIKKRIKKYTKISGLKIKLTLYGIGLSIINETPKETFYLSLYDIYFCYKYSTVKNIINEIDNYKSILFSLKNLQLDYCLDNAYDIIFNPTNQLLPPKFNEKNNREEKNFFDKILEDDVDNTPFIQFVLSQKIKLNKNNSNKINFIYSIYPEIAIFIQEFDVRINTILINSLINVVNEFKQIFLPTDFENNELKKIEDNNENAINDANLLIDNIKDDYNNKLRDNSSNKEGKVNNIVINNLTLSAIKLNATFKVNKNAIEIRLIPELIVTLINTLCSTLSSFSDVTLKLNEISFSNVFSDIDSLSGKLMNYYKKQIFVQVYKIILNIDLLGNPIKLLEGVGSGLFQLFNEPRKGLLKGPEEFGLGITRGARALVSNVVGGGFNSVSKITGTLLNATKNLSSMGTDEEIVIKEEEKPKGLLSGTLSGFRKGLGELTHGVAGIVTKPIQQSQKGGVGGFFKGLGSGLVGAVLAPVNTVLTLGNEVTSGISNSELLTNKKRLRRFRLPRTLYKYLPINPYDEKKEIERKKQREKIEGSDAIIISLNNEKLYFENSTEIIMYKKLRDSTNMIFTNVMIKIMNNECTKFTKKIYLCDIKKINTNNNDIEIIMKDGKTNILKFKEENSKIIFINKINRYLI